MEGQAKEIAVQVWGRKFRGRWRIEGGQLEVSSPWGSDREPMGTARPEDVARRLLKEIVLKNAR